MFIPSRNVWHPVRRSTRALAPPSEPLDQEEPSPDPDALPEPAEFDEEPDIDAWDATDELAAMSDADFLRQLRAGRGRSRGPCSFDDRCHASCNQGSPVGPSAQTPRSLRQSFLRSSASLNAL